MAKSRRHGRKTRRQRGGGDTAYGFNGAAGVSAGGVPFESRGASYTQCGWDVRPAAPDVSRFNTVQFGGRRRASRRSRSLTRASRRNQRGGGCGCMAAPPMQAQRGGVYAADVTSNEMIKMPIYSAAPCPPAPRETQIGGAAADELGLVSFKSGYGFGPASVYSTASAHYLDKLPYDRTVMTGGKRRRSRRHRRSRRRN